MLFEALKKLPSSVDHHLQMSFVDLVLVVLFEVLIHRADLDSDCSNLKKKKTLIIISSIISIILTLYFIRASVPDFSAPLVDCLSDSFRILFLPESMAEG